MGQRAGRLPHAVFNSDTLEMSQIAETVLTLIERRVAEADAS